MRLLLRHPLPYPRHLTVLVQIKRSPGVHGCLRRWLGLWVACLCLPALAGAARAANYVVQATVTDIDGHPLSGVQVAAGAIQVQPFMTDVQPEQTGTTDASRHVTIQLSTSSSPVGAAVVDDDPGRVHLPADPIVRLTQGTNTVAFQLLPPPDATRMAAGGTAQTQGYFGDIGTGTYPPLTSQSFTLDASPLHLWRAYGSQSGRPVLLVQGLFVTTAHPTPMQVFNQGYDLIQALRHAGRDVWVLAFSDPLAPFSVQALAVSDAVRTISQEAGGAKVDVVGLSLGGLAARYALARDEATGGPSAGKVGVFATVDTPHQGANIQVAVQAALWVAGGDTDATGGNLARQIVHAPAVQNVVYEWVGVNHYDKDTCGFPMDSSVKTTTAAHDAFFAELTALNGDGYPHRSRNVAVAASGPSPRPQKVGDVMYQLKASADLLFGQVTLCREDYPARANDVLPGSLFPGALLPDTADVNGVTITLTRQFDPTFVPLASALDLKGTASPFAATFAAKDGPLVHGAFPDGAVSFLMAQLAGG
jgi:hypothetical protein